MILRRLFWRYAYAVALREWARCQRVSPKVRLGVSGTLGAVIAPWVVFVLPAARILWLLTGWRPPRPFDLISPCRYVVANPFSVEQPPEIRELLERPDYRWEPEDEIPRWLDMWARLAQIISWAPPIGARHLPSAKRS